MATATTPKKPKQKREKSTTTKGHYVTNSVLLPAVLEAKELNKVTDKLIRMIQMIAERYSRKANFIRYSFREDMVNAAVMNLCNNALKFKPEKSSNPFSFYTTAIHNSFLQYLADEKKHRNIRDALLIDAGSNPSFNFMEGEKDEHHFEVKESDEIYVNEKNVNMDQEDSPLRVDNELIPPSPREAKIGYHGRAPGEVKRYGPNDITIDPVTGAITIKEKVLDVVAVKKSRKPPAAKKVEKPKSDKVVKVVAKAVKKPVVKAAQKPATKTVAKKPAVKTPKAPSKKTKAV